MLCHMASTDYNELIGCHSLHGIYLSNCYYSAFIRICLSDFKKIFCFLRNDKIASLYIKLMPMGNKAPLAY